MRILSLRMKNLNSLGGDHFLDFSTPPLSDAGLFAITGATGAGKSTILDGITLGLYGKAARYGNTSNPEDMMTRNTGHCLAEVEFESGNSQYRARWELRRAKEKPDGNIQPVHRSIAHIGGTILAEGVKSTEDQVSQIIGLDYQQFIRSALLAQGEFARFLKSNDGERSNLLESLTGATIYTRIGAQVYQQNKSMGEQIAQTRKQLALVQTLAPEELQEREQTLANLQKEYTAGEKQKKELEGQLNLAKQLHQVMEDERTALHNLEQNTLQNQAFQPKAARLELHQRTQELIQPLTLFESREQTLEQTRNLVDHAQQALVHAEKEWERIQHSYHFSLQAAIAQYREKIQHYQQQQASMESQAAEQETWFKEHQSEANLVQDQTILLQLLVDYDKNRIPLDQLTTRWNKTIENLETARENLKLPGTEGRDEPGDLSRTELSLTHCQDLLAQAISDADAAKEHLELANQLQSLAGHRHLLNTGEPCPLCGSLEHPNPLDPEPRDQRQDLKDRLTQAEQRVKITEKILTQIKDARDQLAELGEEILTYRKILEEIGKQITSGLAPYGLYLPEGEGQIHELGKTIRLRVEDYQKRTQERENLSARIQQFQHEILITRDGLDEITKERDTYFTSQPPGDQGPESPPPLSEARKTYASGKNTLTTAQTTLTERTKALESAREQQQAGWATLEQALKNSSFATLDELKNARLSQGEYENLKDEQKNLQDGKTRAQTLLESSIKKKELLLTQGAREDHQPEEMQKKLSILETDLVNLVRKQTAIESEMENHHRNQNQRERILQELADLEDQQTILSRLNDLIGSAKGDRFRKIAQAITMEFLIANANSHLQKLNDRYLIIPKNPDTLDLEIEDTYQGGTHRPVESLSGGETFLVSLALALGLSDLAGRNVRIDSLFIDEGFGSLDPDTLDTAISALESLQQGRKNIGIISHVELLKERISTQIQVEKRSAGTSRLLVKT